MASGFFGSFWGDDVAGGGGETTPPTITVISPTPGVPAGSPGGFPADEAAARLTPIVVEIVDGGAGLRYECVVCRYPGATDELTVYRRGQFRGAFAGLSTESAVTNGKRLTVLPVGGWPSSAAVDDITWDLDAVDAAGNLAP